MKRILCFLLLIQSGFLFSQEGQEATLNFEQPQLEKKPDAPVQSAVPSLAEVWNRLTPNFETRMLYLLKESPESAGRQGFSVMQANIGLDLQLADDLTAVLRYNLGFLGPGPQEVYLEYQAGWIDDIRVGRFPLTFGLKLMDHRIYTKKFFGISYIDFETGLEAAKEVGNFRITASVVQGRGTGEAFQTNEQMVAPALDIRWDFDGSVSGTVGASGLYTFTAAGKKNADTGSAAASIYYRLNLGRFSHSTEVIWGQKRNNLVRDLDVFVGNKSFATNLKGTTSAALFTNLEYAVSSKWKFFYEYDQAVLDTRFMADRFEKHGAGVKWGFHSNSDLEFRVEKYLEGRTENPNLGRNNDALLLTLHAWL